MDNQALLNGLDKVTRMIQAQHDSNDRLHLIVLEWVMKWEHEIPKEALVELGNLFEEETERRNTLFKQAKEA